jgi:flagellar basal body-associated protein FliL
MGLAFSTPGRGKVVLVIVAIAVVVLALATAYWYTSSSLRVTSRGRKSTYASPLHTA